MNSKREANPQFSSPVHVPRTGRWVVAKHFLIIFLPLLVLVCGIITALFYTEDKAERTVIESRDVYDMTLHKETLISDVKLVVSDLMILSGLYEIKRMFEDIEGDHKNELMGLSHEFLTFSKKRALYDQIRLLDETGMEVVMVNFNDGMPYVVPEEQLQFKGHRYYFKETIGLERGEVYISPFDLNIERRGIEQPLKPMIRFGTPILDAHGRKRGVVILNYLGDKLLHDIDKMHVGIKHHTLLLNPDGFWLKGLKHEDEWGFMHEDGKNRTFGNAFPEAWQRISNEESGQFCDEDGLFTFATVYPLLEAHNAPEEHSPLPKDGEPSAYFGQKPSAGTSDAFEPSLLPSYPEAKAYHWKVVNYVSSDILKAGTPKLLSKYYTVFAVLVVVLGGASWVVARARVSRKWAEGELQLFQNLINQSNDAIFVVEPETGLFEYVNDKACSALGYTREELLNMGVVDIEAIMPESFSWKEHVKQVKKKGFMILEGSHKRKDGTMFPVEVNVKYVTEEKKGYMIAVVRDITERKRAEESLAFEINEHKRTEEVLRVSEEKYRRLVESLQDNYFFYSHDTNGIFTYLSPSMNNILGYSPEEFLTHYTEYLTDNPINKEVVHHTELSIKGIKQPPYEVEINHKDGAIRTLQVQEVPIFDKNGKVIAVEGIAEDVTEKKRAERVLRESEKKYRTLIENIPQKIFHKDINSVYVSCNDNYAADLGVKPDEIAGKADYEFYPKFLAEKYRADDRKIMSFGRTVDIEEKYIKDGQEFIVHTVKTPIRDEKGNIVGILGVFWDITEQKKAEEEVRFLNEYLETVLGSIDVGIRVVDPKRNVEYENPPLKKRFGNGVGKPCYLIWHCNLPCEDCTSERAILTNKAQGKEEILPDGQIFSVTSVPLKTRDGRSVAVEIIYDITRLKRNEYEIRSLASRILSVQEDERKRISRELHDEAGQALTAIKLNLKMIEDNFTKDVLNTKKTISSTKNILTQIVQDIKRLSYDLRPATIDDLGMVPALNSYAEEFAERTGINVAVKPELNAQRFPQEVEISLYRIIQEALTNVSKHSKAKNVKIELFKNKTDLVMKVKDDGCGFDTNKNLKEGKLNKGALGLIGIRERATSLGGSLEITSARNKGTKLIVKLPLGQWHIHS